MSMIPILGRSMPSGGMSSRSKTSCRWIALAAGIAIGLVAPQSFAQDPNFEIRLVDTTGTVGEDVHLPIELTSQTSGVEGWWLSVCIDDPALVPTEMVLSDAILALDGGAGPEAFIVELDPLGGSGVTCGTVLSSSGDLSIGPVLDLVVVTMSYDTTAAIGFTTYPVTFCDGLSAPPADTTSVIVDGALVAPVLHDGIVFLEYPIPVPFIRGDTDNSGGAAVGDVIAMLAHLFSGQELGCLDAADANADATIDLADPLYLLDYLFAGGSPPATPFPNCGVSKAIGCMSFDGCGP